ncbi:MAG: hypothetical protein WCH21_04955 [Bacteroidota bacterium]
MAGRTQSIEEQINSAIKTSAATAARITSAKAVDKAKLKAQQTKANSEITRLVDLNQRLKDEMKAPEGLAESVRKQMINYRDLNHLPKDETLWTLQQRTQYNEFKQTRDTNLKIVKGLQAQWDANNTKVIALRAEVKRLSNILNPTAPTPPKTPPIPRTPGQTIYNAPMVSKSYFRGIQTELLNGNYVDAGNYTDAINAWSIDPKTGQPMGGRGTIQMDYQTKTAAVVAKAQKDTGFSGVVDPTPYGFKFLYNPQTVGMSWGAIAQTDPVYQASGQDPFVAGTSNLVNSFIEFSILLNRIQDFNYINENGLISNSSKTSTYVNTNTLAGIQAASTVAKSPYPQFASKNGANEEFKAIYEKGTMYDLEYLFKTMHGQGAYASYKSVLMGGTTSDPGWLPVRPVELHLGNKLRYRVRISNLSVNHTIFNSRMVPILSTVNITCARYWDGTGELSGKFTAQ